MNEAFQHILTLYFNGETLSDDQESSLQQWLKSSPCNEEALRLLEDRHFLRKAIRVREEYAVNQDKNWERLLEQINPVEEPQLILPVHRTHVLKSAWFRYAAAIILIAGSVAYLWNTDPKVVGTDQKINSVASRHDVLPGSDKAILTLSNGQKVELNSTAQQTITDGELTIENKNGILTYGKSDVIVYNTMSTPKGGQYKLTLPDGSNVWLNAASSITFPTSFTGNTREVKIVGEAYFEVAKNPEKPFTVKTIKEEITVLGTHFNVNAYQDEPLSKISLLEGSVKIGDRILKPGEAYIDDKVVKTNLVQDLAWKNGVFNFNDQNLEQVMRQLSRWYDVEVIYPKNVPKMEFWGEMGKNLKLSQVLEILEKSEVKFKIEDGKRLVVLP